MIYVLKFHLLRSVASTFFTDGRENLLRFLMGKRNGSVAPHQIRLFFLRGSVYSCYLSGLSCLGHKIGNVFKNFWMQDRSIVLQVPVVTSHMQSRNKNATEWVSLCCIMVW